MHNRSFSKNQSSISPSRCYEFKQNYSESGNSIYDLKDSASTWKPPTEPHKKHNHLSQLQLQSNILQLQKTIDQQKYQIDTLTLQTQNYMNICEQQKQQLDNTNIQMLRQQYEEQINELVDEKDKITNIIYALTEEYKQTEIQQQTELNILKSKNIQLAKLIELAMNEKEQMLTEIKNADQEHSNNELIILEQEQRIDDLRNIERKLMMALNELKQLQRQNS